MIKFIRMSLLLLSVSPLFAQDSPQAKTMSGRAMTVEDLFVFQRVGAPSLSPDGLWVVYSSNEITDSRTNKSVSRLWLVPTDGSAAPRQLTNPTAKDNNPRWSPDGRWILFESNRSGSMQLWVISPFGGEAQQLTTVSTGASTAVWSPDGRHIAFVSGVYPEFSSLPFAESDKKNKAKADEIEASPVKARVFKRLFYRHWDSYVDDKRQHLFVVDITEAAPGVLKAGEPRDVTPGDRDAYPTSTTFQELWILSSPPTALIWCSRLFPKRTRHGTRIMTCVEYRSQAGHLNGRH